ncbi:GIY-YIG nuclease family protein [Bradyrhizobium jicamae]|uniref:GIY-YIG nuclease family protein n=1 Tax=Bradyrhizobium jicamae TaxID=280332 RepID=UPI001BAC18CA|nr:GIY-YIG nuclease family protein [Bradyrhizobium jicamae]MBR0757182.1 GIY-YIG nuclease family protein [Bradyrhizobium jicamae]
MKAEARKLAIADYKKRPSIAGIFAIRCARTGEVWVGQTYDLDKIQNRIWFSLRMGDHKNAELQRAWTTHGEASLSLEAVEKLKEEELPYVRDAILKERLAHWRATLGAQAA